MRFLILISLFLSIIAPLNTLAGDIQQSHATIVVASAENDEDDGFSTTPNLESNGGNENEQTAQASLLDELSPQIFYL